MHPAMWRVTDFEPAGLGHAFTLQHESGMSVKTRVGMPGKFNIANAALAAVMVFAGHPRQDWERIKAALEDADHTPFESAVPGRMEVISDAPTAAVHFAHNPDGLTQALQAVNPSSQQRHGTAGRTSDVLRASGRRAHASR